MKKQSLVGCDLSGKCCKTGNRTQVPQVTAQRPPAEVPRPARVSLRAAVTLMMGPAAQHRGQTVPACCYLQTVAPWLSQCVPLGAQVGSVSTSIPFIPPLSPGPEVSPQEKGGRRCRWTRCLPENIKPFTPIYCCNTNSGFIFS